MLSQQAIWLKKPTESKRAYDAFAHYRDMGAGRSIDKAYVLLWSETHQNATKTPPKEAPRHWSEWSSKFAWVERAKAYDAYLDAQLQQQFEDELIMKRQQVIHDELADSELQLAKWREMFELMPVAADRAKDWGTLSRWRGEIGDQMRRALGMPTQRTDLTSGGEKLAVVPSIEFVWMDSGDNGGHDSEPGSN